MRNLVDWNWFIGRRSINVTSWFKDNGIENYDQAIEFATRLGLTEPKFEEVEQFLARPNVAKDINVNSPSNNHNDTNSDDSDSVKTRKKRTRKPSTKGSIEATEALEKSEKTKRAPRKTRAKKTKTKK